MKNRNWIGTVVLLAWASHTAGAEPFVGNGIKTNGFPAVVQIQALYSQGQMASCTATWVSPRALLTASHCVVSVIASETEYALVLPKSMVIDGVPSRTTVLVNSAMNPKALLLAMLDRVTSAFVERDLALILVQEGAKPRAWYPFSNGMKKVGSGVVLVGYGYGSTDYDFNMKSMKWVRDANDGWGQGTKRMGRNTIASYEGSTIKLQGNADVDRVFGLFDRPTGVQAVPLPGDSGGPLLVQTQIGNRFEYQLIGVISSVGFRSSKNGDAIGSITNIHESKNWAWIQSVLSQN